RPGGKVARGGGRSEQWARLTRYFAMPSIQIDLKLQKRGGLPLSAGENMIVTQASGTGRPGLYGPIEKDVQACETIFERQLESHRPGVARLLDHLVHYRGKRLRPALLLLTARACGQVVNAHHVLAAVVEMIHTATLVHDDVLDEAA